METATYQEIQVLFRMTTGELRGKYLEVFGEETRAHNKDFLRKRIAWRLQTLVEGDLSERARKRAEELASDADLRIRPPRNFTRSGTGVVRKRSAKGYLSPSRDPRLPLPGTLLIRKFKGRNIVVKVLEHGFEYNDRPFKSLSQLPRKSPVINGTALPFLLSLNPGHYSNTRRQHI